MKWTKDEPGEYTSDNGRWRITRSDGRQWDVELRLPSEDWELWGEWEYRDRYGQGHGYIPFRTLTDAQVMVEEYHNRGFDLSDEEAGIC